MNTTALLMVVVSLGLVLGTWVWYLIRISRGTVPVRPLGSVVSQWLGLGLAIASVGWSVHRDGTASGAVVALAAPCVMLSAFFLWLLSQRKTPIGELKVKVGDALLPFRAMTSAGATFDTEQLAGERTLLKFFRGGW